MEHQPETAAPGRNLYFEGQFGAEEAEDTEQRLMLVRERDELLFAVERKFPGETRFQTALRYIREAEAKNYATPKRGSLNALPCEDNADEHEACTTDVTPNAE